MLTRNGRIAEPPPASAGVFADAKAETPSPIPAAADAAARSLRRVKFELEMSGAVDVASPGRMCLIEVMD